MKYELYSGDLCLLTYDEIEYAPICRTPSWLWQYGVILIGEQIVYCKDDLEMMVDGRRAWRMKLPKDVIERRESPITHRRGCCRD